MNHLNGLLGRNVPSQSETENTTVQATRGELVWGGVSVKQLSLVGASIAVATAGAVYGCSRFDAITSFFGSTLNGAHSSSADNAASSVSSSTSQILVSKSGVMETGSSTFIFKNDSETNWGNNFFSSFGFGVTSYTDGASEWVRTQNSKLYDQTQEQFLNPTAQAGLVAFGVVAALGILYTRYCRHCQNALRIQKNNESASAQAGNSVDKAGPTVPPVNSQHSTSDLNTTNNDPNSPSLLLPTPANLDSNTTPADFWTVGGPSNENIDLTDGNQQATHEANDQDDQSPVAPNLEQDEGVGAAALSGHNSHHAHSLRSEIEDVTAANTASLNESQRGSVTPQAVTLSLYVTDEIPESLAPRSHSPQVQVHIAEIFRDRLPTSQTHHLGGDVEELPLILSQSHSKEIAKPTESLEHHVSDVALPKHEPKSEQDAAGQETHLGAHKDEHTHLAARQIIEGEGHVAPSHSAASHAPFHVQPLTPHPRLGKRDDLALHPKYLLPTEEIEPQSAAHSLHVGHFPIAPSLEPVHQAHHVLPALPATHASVLPHHDHGTA